jgi:hypothetical protein
MATGSLSGDIQVVTADPVTGLITFGIKPRIVAGMAKLIQIVVLALLNTPGKDILNPAGGGGLLSIVGTNIESTDSTQILAELNRSVKKVQTEVINNQSGLDLPAEELLKELQILSLTKGQTDDEVLLKIRLINQAGRISDVVL